MGQDQHDNARGNDRRRARFDLFYYEREGDRYYLRFTRFALALFVIFPLLVILLLVMFFLSGTSQSIPDVDVTIKPPPAETPTPRLILTPTPPPRTAPTVRRGPAPANTHAAPTPSPGGNANE